jgi:hypothetical protein
MDTKAKQATPTDMEFLKYHIALYIKNKVNIVVNIIINWGLLEILNANLLKIQYPGSTRKVFFWFLPAALNIALYV